MTLYKDNKWNVYTENCLWYEDALWLEWELKEII